MLRHSLRPHGQAPADLGQCPVAKPDHHSDAVRQAEFEHGSGAPGTDPRSQCLVHVLSFLAACVPMQREIKTGKTVIPSAEITT